MPSPDGGVHAHGRNAALGFNEKLLRQLFVLERRHDVQQNDILRRSDNLGPIS
jgi:hypothetical protein